MSESKTEEKNRLNNIIQQLGCNNWLNSSNIIDGIKAVLFFFTNRFHTHKKHKKRI